MECRQQRSIAIGEFALPRSQRKKVARNAGPSGGGNGIPLSLAEVYAKAVPRLALLSSSTISAERGSVNDVFIKKNRFPMEKPLFMKKKAFHPLNLRFRLHK
jgi:hypothetical protein